MQLTSMVEEAVREVIDAVMNARTYTERFKKDCSMNLSLGPIAFDLAVVPDAKGQTVELADAGHLKDVETSAGASRGRPIIWRNSPRRGPAQLGLVDAGFAG
jgi:hypothetical protein